MAKNQHEMETEYNNFVQQLSDFVNQEITQFGHKLTLLERTSQNIQNIGSQIHEIAQATSRRMDLLGQQLGSICSGQKEEADQAVGYAIFGVKTEILSEVDQEVEELEKRLEAKKNKARYTTSTNLQEIKDSVAAVRESQQKMWGLSRG